MTRLALTFTAELVLLLALFFGIPVCLWLLYGGN